MARDIDYEIVQLLRQLAHERRPVADVLRVVETGRTALGVVKHFREAFGLSLEEAKPIGGWLWYGRSDSWIHDHIWPAIDAHREHWDPESRL